MKKFIDKYYRYIRPFRFLYGWAKDSHTAAKTSKRAEEWKAKGFKGAKLDICGGRNPINPDEFLNVDIVDFPQVDLAFDITQKFPIDDGVIVEVFSAATLEHFRKHHNEHILKEFMDGEELDYINQHFFGKYKSGDTDDYDVHRWMYPASKMIEALQEIGFENVEQIENNTGLHNPKYNYLIKANKPK